jgi:hypothetical protein
MWTDATLNARATAAASECPTLTLHSADPGDSGAAEVASASLSWSAGGVEGPEPSVQPATVGIAYAAPSVSLPSNVSITYYGFRSGGTFRGGFRMQAPIETVGAESRTIPVRIGPNA